MHYQLERDAEGNETVRCPLRGRDLLQNGMFNKGTAFTHEERRAFDLVGLLPPTPADPDVQLERAYQNIMRKTDPLERYIGLAALQDRNEILFYRVVLEHLEQLAPIVYTPTVGRACQTYSHIFRRGRGIWISPDDEGRIAEVLRNASGLREGADIRLIVATDNERILGLGDQGAGGMGIPIGKLVLYTVGAGIHPTQVLPVSLDVGTDNQALLDDPLYLGWRQPRVRGERYHRIVEEFVQAVMECFPRALLQWEDFKKNTAFELLDRYRERLLSFNDDIQGTAAVALSGVMAATRITGTPMAEQRVVILGAGAAGVGIGRQLRDALRRAGLQGDDLIARIAVLDSQGLLVAEQPTRDPYKKEFAWPAALIAAQGIDPDGPRDLRTVIDAVAPTVLIGTSGQPGTFTRDAIEAMARHCDRPVVFPFSNPTSKCEAKPEDVIAWTDGRAIIASGSPFEPVVHAGRTHRIAQGNNVYIFPGLGLGALCAGARQVSDTMFTVAAETLAGEVSQDDLDELAVYPKLSRLREISAKIAVAVALEAADEQLCPPLDAATAERCVRERMWYPRYPRLVPS